MPWKYLIDRNDKAPSLFVYGTWAPISLLLNHKRGQGTRLRRGLIWADACSASPPDSTTAELRAMDVFIVISFLSVQGALLGRDEL